MFGMDAKFECSVSLEDKANCIIYLRQYDKAQHINKMVSKIRKISLINPDDKCYKSRCLWG